MKYCRRTQGAQPAFGIAIKGASSGTSLSNFFLMANGSIKEYSRTSVRFRIDNFIPVEQINELIHRSRDAGKIPLDFAKDMISKLQDFGSQCHEACIACDEQLKDLSEKIRHPTNDTFMSLKDIATLAFPYTPSVYEMYAVHLKMIKERSKFSADDRNHDRSQMWNIRSTAFIENQLRVSQWMRASSGLHLDHVNAFIDKARHVIDEFRRLKHDPEILAEIERENQWTKRMTINITWDEHDIEIIEFLLNWTQKDALAGSANDTLAAQFLRSVDRYPDVLFNRQCMNTFFGEIGVLHLWEDLFLRRQTLQLPGHNKHFQGEEDSSYLENLETDTEYISELKNSDALSSLRHDWENEQVFCVDSAESLEIDDGISVTKIPDSKEVWVRIHVANPTAFIPLEHRLGQIMKRRCSTFYSANRAYTLLPHSITESFLSLAPNSPCITFSARVDTETGETKETDIRPGILRNVKRVTYVQLQYLIDGQNWSHNEEILKNLHWFTNRTGSHWHAKHTQLAKRWSPDVSGLSEEDKAALLLIRKTAVALGQYRVRQGGTKMAQVSNSDVRVDDGRGNMPHPILSPQPVVYIGKPFIDVILNMERITTQAGDTIQELMVFACSILGSWFAQRNIPAPFRGLDVEWSSEEDRKAYEYIKPYSAADTEKELAGIVLDILKFIPVGRVVATPARHALLGVAAYVKCTSPLRRYGDFLAHHILQHELLNERRPTEQKLPPLLAGVDMEEMVANFALRELISSMGMRDNSRYWQMMLKRELQAKENDQQIPKVFEATVVYSASPISTTCVVMVTNFNVQGSLHCDDIIKLRSLRLGDTVYATERPLGLLQTSPLILDLDLVSIKETGANRREKLFAMAEKMKNETPELIAPYMPVLASDNGTHDRQMDALATG